MLNCISALQMSTNVAMGLFFQQNNLTSMMKTNLALLFALIALTGHGHAQSIQWRGLLDLRATKTTGERSWTDAGLGKSRTDSQSNRLSIGQAVLRGELDLPHKLSATLVASADEQHHGVLDVREAWLGWNPVPSSAWKTRVKLGFFFMPSSVEIDYDDIAWTPTRTISSSAINSWIGEELRTNGIQLQLLRSGRQQSSPHDFGLTAAIFNGNDPTGTLLAWRGWSISDRIGGRNQADRLVDLPVIRPDGAIPRQNRTIHPFREIDGRFGYYIGANYQYGDWLELALMHYDNRADPLEVKHGQYGWHTRFDHLNLVLRPAGSWEILLQAMRGDTLMGKNAVAIDYQSWYVLLAHPLGRGKLALRYDRFSTSEHDIQPQDPNSEQGHALALAYNVDVRKNLTWITEYLHVNSEREARHIIGIAPQQRERSLTTALRWQF